jgi:hypothetical protein
MYYIYILYILCQYSNYNSTGVQSQGSKECEGVLIIQEYRTKFLNQNLKIDSSGIPSLLEKNSITPTFQDWQSTQ